MSETDNTFYCIGKNDATNVNPVSHFTLESLSWETGEQNWLKELGLLDNPMYAGNEIGADHDFIIGTLLGPMRIV